MALKRVWNDKTWKWDSVEVPGKKEPKKEETLKEILGKKAKGGAISATINNEKYYMFKGEWYIYDTFFEKWHGALDNGMPVSGDISDKLTNHFWEEIRDYAFEAEKEYWEQWNK